MKAKYYAIINSQNEIVEDGILGPYDYTIFPGQTTEIKELPSECELHHFKVPGYRIEVCNFVTTREYVMQQRTGGDKLSIWAS